MICESKVVNYVDFKWKNHSLFENLNIFMLLTPFYFDHCFNEQRGDLIIGTGDFKIKIMLRVVLIFSIIFADLEIIREIFEDFVTPEFVQVIMNDCITVSI